MAFTCFLSIQNFFTEVAGASLDHHEFASVAIPSQLGAPITWRGKYYSSMQLRVNLKRQYLGDAGCEVEGQREGEQVWGVKQKAEVTLVSADAGTVRGSTH